MIVLPLFGYDWPLTIPTPIARDLPLFRLLLPAQHLPRTLFGPLFLQLAVIPFPCHTCARTHGNHGPDLHGMPGQFQDLIPQTQFVDPLCWLTLLHPTGRTGAVLLFTFLPGRRWGQVYSVAYCDLLILGHLLLLLTWTTRSPQTSLQAYSPSPQWRYYCMTNWACATCQTLFYCSDEPGWLFLPFPDNYLDTRVWTCLHSFVVRPQLPRPRVVVCWWLDRMGGRWFVVCQCFYYLQAEEQSPYCSVPYHDLPCLEGSFAGQGPVSACHHTCHTHTDLSLPGWDCFPTGQMTLTLPFPTFPIPQTSFYWQLPEPVAVGSLKPMRILWAYLFLDSSSPQWKHCRSLDYNVLTFIVIYSTIHTLSQFNCVLLPFSFSARFRTLALLPWPPGCRPGWFGDIVSPSDVICRTWLFRNRWWFGRWWIPFPPVIQPQLAGRMGLCYHLPTLFLSCRPSPADMVLVLIPLVCGIIRLWRWIWITAHCPIVQHHLVWTNLLPCCCSPANGTQVLLPGLLWDSCAPTLLHLIVCIDFTRAPSAITWRWMRPYCVIHDQTWDGPQLPRRRRWTSHCWTLFVPHSSRTTFQIGWITFFFYLTQSHLPEKDYVLYWLATQQTTG